jgi:hypothetical protein
MSAKTKAALPAWKQVAEEAWDAPSWKEAAKEYPMPVRTPPAEELKKLRALMDDGVSLERAYREFNPPPPVRPRQPAPPAIQFDKGLTLDQIVDTVRPLVADAKSPTKQRVRALWAAAKAARACGASDVIHRAFMDLALEANLIDRRGHWTGNDVRADVIRHGAEDVAHVITWAMRGWNPFEIGPLK